MGNLENRGLHVVRLHQALNDWRARRLLAYRFAWPPLSVALIEAEIARLQAEIAECVRRWI